MEKRLYNVTLKQGCDQDHFLHEGDAKNCQCVDELPEIDGLVLLSLTHEEALNLIESEEVIDMQVELPVIETLYPEITPVRSQTADLVTFNYPSISVPGSNYASQMFHWTSDIPIAGNTEPLGSFSSEDKRSENEVITQNYAGAYVDIVAIEAGTSLSMFDSYVNHPDFLDDQGNTRFVKMDWNNHGAGINDAQNRQVTNNTTFFSAHAIGVLSIAAGLYCGWAKVSSLRVIYLSSDSVSSVYNAVLAWHNSKPVNPITGVRNATVTTGAWGFVGAEHNFAFPIDTIDTIQAYNQAGTLTVIERPGGGWGSNLSSFYNNGIVPRVLRDPADNTQKWCVSIPISDRATFLDTIFNDYNSAGGIYHFKSAGNNAHVAVKPNDARWNTRVFTDANSNYIQLTLSSGQYVFSSVSTVSGVSGYPLRTYADGANNAITVAACQHSTANPLLDSYSNRGPMIDVAGLGAFTWTAVPTIQYADGNFWGYFSGTSCAAPNVAGVAAVMIDHFFTQRGVYPTTQQLKQLIENSAKPVLESESPVNFSSVSAAGDITSSRLNTNTFMYQIRQNTFQNGGSNLPHLDGTPNLRVFLPYKIRLGNGKYISDIRGVAFGSRPTNGQAYPRRKIKIG